MQFTQKIQQILITVLGVSIHVLGKNSKKKIEQGKCSVCRNQENYFAKVSNTSIVINNIKFAQMKYPHTISYFFLDQKDQNQVKVLSILIQENNQQLLSSFHNILINYSHVQQLTDLQSDNELLKIIRQVYPQYLTKEVKSTGTLTKISKEVGGLVGSLSGLIKRPAQTVAHTVQNKSQEIYETRISNDTKNKWQGVKDKASKLNDTVSQAFKPVSDGARNITTKLGHNFNHSNNSIIKAIRDFGLKTKNALNQGYQQGMGGQNVQHEAVKGESDSMYQIQVQSLKQ